jgi:hypothetical protein
VRYVREVFQQWSPDIGAALGGIDNLIANLGLSLRRILYRRFQKTETAKFLLTKTPSIQGIDNLFSLIPDARLIIIVRDGRDVVVSAMRSFDCSFDAAAREWALSAETLTAFCADPANEGKPYLVVRYEDLFNKTEAELRRVFAFLGLDVGRYNWDHACSLPVNGSCESRTERALTIHWQDVERTVHFRPVGRWKDWPRSFHERFNWLAGEMLSQYGYAPVEMKDYRAYWSFRNRLGDLLRFARYGCLALIGRPLRALLGGLVIWWRQRRNAA